MFPFVERAVVAPLAKLMAVRSEKGVTAIEYALIAGVVVVAIVAAVTVIGATLGTTFNTLANNISTP